MTPKQVLVVEWVISYNHMRLMLAALCKRQHQHMGFYAEFEDFGNVWSRVKTRPHLYDSDGGKRNKVFRDYSGSVQGGLLRIYRDVKVMSNVQPVEIINETALTTAEIIVLKRLVAAVTGSRKS